MKGCNRALKKLKNLLIIISIILICSVTHIYATDGDDGTETEATNLPYIEMKVKFKSNQVLVEMWGANFTNLEGMEMVFTYNNEKLTPSIVNSNEAIDNLDEFKYDKRPTNYENAQTDFEKAERDEFNSKSKETLSNSFAFDNNALEIDTFLYLETNENIEAMQFVISRKDFLQDINATATDPILLGKFSFKQTEGTAIEETDFATKRIKIYCDDGATEDDYSYYIREGEICTDIVEFTYEQKGSISGTIITKDVDSYNIATIKIYKKNEVESIKWDSVESEYDEQRSKLEELEKIEYTTKVDDNGKFLIEVPFGRYVILIDKYMYVDYIITDIDVSNAETINLDEKIGNIELIVGDYDKNGVIDAYDRSNFIDAYNKKPKDDTFDIDDTGELDAYDRERFIVSYNMYRNKTDVKKVETLGNN